VILFLTAIHGEGPALEEIEQYAQRLLELKNAGAEISLVRGEGCLRVFYHTAPSG
jgi:hypothetical protein